jgi:hypothetical protein
VRGMPCRSADSNDLGRAARRLGDNDVRGQLGPEPVTVIMEQYFIPLAEEQGHLARDITRSLAVDRMLPAQDEEGLTPAEAATVGGPALDRVLALLDDCEWRRLRRQQSGEPVGMLPDLYETAPSHRHPTSAARGAITRLAGPSLAAAGKVRSVPWPDGCRSRARQAGSRPENFLCRTALAAYWLPPGGTTYSQRTAAWIWSTSTSSTALLPMSS